MPRKRSQRNRKRPGSGGRRLICPQHGCPLASASQKHRLFAETVDQLQEYGFGRKQAALVLRERAGVVIEDVWLEAFWCDVCQRTTWYQVVRLGERQFRLAPVHAGFWRHTCGTVDPTRGNPSVSEFSLRHSRGPLAGRLY